MDADDDTTVAEMLAETKLDSEAVVAGEHERSRATMGAGGAATPAGFGLRAFRGGAAARV